MVMEKFGKSLDNMIRKIRRLPRIDKDALKLVIQDLQRALLSADVNVEICLALTENIRKRAFNEKISAAIARKDFIIKLIHDELVGLLGGSQNPR